jgi:adenylyltransferase/sulfurtransferase
MGVGTIGIVDGDTVDVSNLQRQVIHSESDIGRSKAESARDTVEGINSNVNVVTYQVELTPDTAEGVFNDYEWDVVLDGSDNFPTKYLISDLCEIHKVPFVYSAISAFEGQVCVFNNPPGGGPTFRDYMPQPPKPEEIPSCAEGGVIGVVPGIFGTVQVREGRGAKRQLGL